MKIYLEEGQALEQEIMEKLEDAASYILFNEGVDSKRSQLSLTLTEPDEIRRLNREYRDTDSVTDVLSFPQFESVDDMPRRGQLCLGDVVICRQRISEQALEYGHSFERELVYLFVHSMLHLLGYDHMEENDKKIMREKEEKVMDHLDLRR